MERKGREVECTVTNILSEQSRHNGLANPGPVPSDFHACFTLSSGVRQAEAGSSCFGAVLRWHVCVRTCTLGVGALLGPMGHPVKAIGESPYLGKDTHL